MTISYSFIYLSLFSGIFLSLFLYLPLWLSFSFLHYSLFPHLSSPLWLCCFLICPLCLSVSLPLYLSLSMYPYIHTHVRTSSHYPCWLFILQLYRDIVPHNPFESFGYRHVFREWYENNKGENITENKLVPLRFF